MHQSEAWGHAAGAEARLAELRSSRALRSTPRSVRAPDTRSTAFQQWHGLTPDGIAGPRLPAKLRTALVPQPGKKGSSRRIEVYRPKAVTVLIERAEPTGVIHSSAGKHGHAIVTGTYLIVRGVLKDGSYGATGAWMPYASYVVRGYARLTRLWCPAIPHRTVVFARHLAIPRTRTGSR